MDTVRVDAAALRTVLQALVGDDHLIRELQVLRGMDHDGINLNISPIGVLIKDYNDADQAGEESDYTKASNLYDRFLKKAKHLSEDENRLAAALSLYCGRHPDNPFNK